jgi:hypothetical protein
MANVLLRVIGLIKRKTHYANQTKKEIELYTSIDTLLLYNWDRYLATKDNNFIIGYDGRQVKVQSDVLTQLEVYTRRIFQRDKR